MRMLVDVVAQRVRQVLYSAKLFTVKMRKAKRRLVLGAGLWAHGGRTSDLQTDAQMAGEWPIYWRQSLAASD
jgi:hypothetical protein